MLRLIINQQLRLYLSDRFRAIGPRAKQCEWGDIDEILRQQLVNQLALLVMDQFKEEEQQL